MPTTYMRRMKAAWWQSAAEKRRIWNSRPMMGSASTTVPSPPTWVFQTADVFRSLALGHYLTYGASFGFAFYYPYLRGKLRRKFTAVKNEE